MMDNLKQTIEELIEKRKYKIALAIIGKEDNFQSDLDMLQFAVEIYINLGNIEKAMEFNKLSMLLDPNSVISHIQLSNIYSLSRRQEDALAESKFACSLDKSSSLALSSYGSMLLNLGQLTEAENILSQAISITPSNRFAQYNLAIVFLGKKQYLKAIRIFWHVFWVKPTPIGFLIFILKACYAFVQIGLIRIISILINIIVVILWVMTFNYLWLIPIGVQLIILLFAAYIYHKKIYY